MGSVVRAVLGFLVACAAFRHGTCIPPPGLWSGFRLSFGLSPHVLDGAGPRVRRASGRGASLNTWACDTVTSVPDAVRASLTLHSFYTKYTHAYGVPVLSSNLTHDAALTRACYLVRFMLADRRDVRDAMHDRYGRVGLISIDEATTDIPEHSHLDDFWDTRARGLGGTLSTPVTTCGEENVLCMHAFDRWFEEDVLLHEFAHAVHLISMRTVGGTFETRLTESWRLARDQGLWNNTYAIVNAREYWAEGVQVFFDAQTCPEVANSLHNTICTRDLLRDYDPRLYALIAEVFPCLNTIVDRCDDQAKVNTFPMRMNCDSVATAAPSSAVPTMSAVPSVSGVTTITMRPGMTGTKKPVTTGEGNVSVSPGIGGGACRIGYRLDALTLVLSSVALTLAK